MIARARTRLLHRRRQLRNLALASLLGVALWWCGLLLAAAILSRQQGLPMPALMTPSLIELTPAPDQPSPQQARRSEPPLASPALPALELPAIDGGLALPQVALPEMPQLAMPRLVLPGAPTAVPDGGEGDGRSGEQQARLLAAPSLDRYYPSRARRRGIEGSTTLALRIDAEGRVVSSRVLRSEPAGVFEEAAMRAARRLRYEPRAVDGQAAAARVRVTFDWRLR